MLITKEDVKMNIYEWLKENEYQYGSTKMVSVELLKDALKNGDIELVGKKKKYKTADSE